MSKFHPAILIPEMGSKETLSPDEQDTLDQADFIEGLCRELNYHPTRIICGLDLHELKKVLNETRPDCCINLIEQLDGNESLIPVIPLFLEHMRIPCISPCADNYLTTTNKILCKKVLKKYGINTPAFYDGYVFSEADFIPGKYIIKPVSRDGSVGVEKTNIIHADSTGALQECVRENEKNRNCPYFAEQFIKGREFNAAAICSKKKNTLFPVSEIQFLNYPRNKPKILCYKSKWIEDSFEFNNTLRTFTLDDADSELVYNIQKTALDCIKAFELRGFVRIDFRADKDTIHVLEININPCLMPDCHFMSAGREAGLSNTEILELIIKRSMD